MEHRCETWTSHAILRRFQNHKHCTRSTVFSDNNVSTLQIALTVPNIVTTNLNCHCTNKNVDCKPTIFVSVQKWAHCRCVAATINLSLVIFLQHYDGPCPNVNNVEELVCNTYHLCHEQSGLHCEETSCDISSILLPQTNDTQHRLSRGIYISRYKFTKYLLHDHKTSAYEEYIDFPKSRFA